MKRLEQYQHNDKVLAVLTAKIQACSCLPSYRVVVEHLNSEGISTSRGNAWTPKRLFRMLQRSGYSGLWGLCQAIRC